MNFLFKHLLAVLIGFNIAACHYSGDNTDALLKRAQIVLPSTAEVLEHKVYVSKDGMEFLKLKMPISSLPAFLEQSDLYSYLNNRTDKGPGRAIFNGILDTHPEKFRQGQKGFDDGYFLDVLIDEDNNNSIVYLLYFGT